MFKTKYNPFYISRILLIKRLKYTIVTGLFLGGNLFSTFPVYAGPRPASNIVVDPTAPVNKRPSIDVTNNGIDQINIAHPNNAGVSHNLFNQYNVNESGQILNNSSTITKTKLAGQITGNPNLNDNHNANLIINEVTGRSPTRLLGYTEIAGKQAALVIANPSGITCAGCGFVNTTRTSLATGKTQFDQEGHLQSININDGEVAFEGKGGNFAEVPVLDIISRKVRIEGPVNGQDIKIIAGRNTYDYVNGTATAQEPDNSQRPEFAIDTSVLGGMTGNHIQMMVNEKGAGVRVDGRMASTAGDMQLTADGKLLINGEMSARNNLRAKIDIVENTGTIGADKQLSLQANSLTNSGKIIANGNDRNQLSIRDNLTNSGSILSQAELQLTAQNINNTQSGMINSQQNLFLSGHDVVNNGQMNAVNGSLQGNFQGNVTNHGTLVSNNMVNLSAAGRFDNSSGQIGSLSKGDVTVHGGDINNQSGLIRTGQGNVSLTGSSLDNGNGSILTTQGDIGVQATGKVVNKNGRIGTQASGNVRVSASGDISNDHGQIVTPSGIVDIGGRQLNNDNGQIGSNAGNVHIESDGLMNRSGMILAGSDNGFGDIVFHGGDIENSNGVIQASSGVVELGMGNYTDTEKGLVYAGKSLQVNAGGNMEVSGNIQARQGLSLVANNLSLNDKDASISSLNGDGTLAIANGLLNAGSLYSSKGYLTLSASSLSNSGSIFGKTATQLLIGNLLTNEGSLSDTYNTLKGGMIQSEGDINIAANSLNNTGLINGSKAVTLKLDGDVINHSMGQYSGVIQSGKTMRLTAKTLQNDNGQILSDDNLHLNVSDKISNGGFLQASKGLTLSTSFLDNSGNILALDGDLAIIPSQLIPTLSSITNTGKIQANGNIIINAAAYQGDDMALLTAQKQIHATYTGNVGNNGQIAAGSGLNLTSNSLINGISGLIYTDNNDLTLTVMGQQGLFNLGNIQTNAVDSHLLLNSLTMINEGIVFAKGKATLKANQQFINRINQDHVGQILVQGGDLTVFSSKFNNAGILIGHQNLQLVASVLENNGYVSAVRSLNIQTSERTGNQTTRSGISFNNEKLASGSLIGDTVQIFSQVIDNEGGWIQGKDTVNLTADRIDNNLDGVILSTNANTILQGRGSTVQESVPVNIINNNQGNIQAFSDLSIAAKQLNNNNGVLTSQKGNIRINQGSSALALEQFLNEKGTVQSFGDIDLAANHLENSEESKILSNGLLSLTIGSDFVNQGNLWGGRGINLSASNLVNTQSGMISADQGSIIFNIQKGYLKNQGIVQNIDTSGNISVFANTFVNDNGRIYSNSDINLQADSLLSNQNNGEITAYKQGNITLSASALNNQGLILAGGQLVANSSADINNLENGYLYGSKGLVLNSNTAIHNQAHGQIGSDTGTLSLVAPRVTLDRYGQVLTSNGTADLIALQALNNKGWLQAKQNIQIFTPSLDNSEGVIISTNGGTTIAQNQNGNGLNELNNYKGTLQAATGMNLYANNINNQGGMIITQQATDENVRGNMVLAANRQNQALSFLNLNENGIIQSSGNIDMHVLSNGLSSTGQILSAAALNATIEGDLKNNSIIFGALRGANEGGLVNLNIHGDYEAGQDGGITSNGDIHVTARNIINNGVILAMNGLVLDGTSLQNNQSGLLSSGNNLTINIKGNNGQNTLNNYGVIQSDLGSIAMDVDGDIINKGGLIRTQSANGDIAIKAASFTNSYTGKLVTETIDSTTIYDKAINDEGQEGYGKSNKQIALEEDLNTSGWGGDSNLYKYFWKGNVKMIKVYAPKDMYKADGTPASGYFYMFLSQGRGNPKARIEVTETGTRTTLKGSSAIVTAGHDLIIETSGKIVNDVSHLEAGHDMTLNASSLDNIGYKDDITFKLVCHNGKLCRSLYPKDPANAANPPYAHPPPLDGNNKNIAYVWGDSSYNPGLSGTIMAGGTLIGIVANQVNNRTIKIHASPDDYVTVNPSLPSGKQLTSVQSETGRNGLNGPGEGNLVNSSSSGKGVNGQNTTLPGYGGVGNPEGIDPGLHVHLPGFNYQGVSASVDDILSSIAGGHALFRPNLDIKGNDTASIGEITGGNIHSINNGNINNNKTNGKINVIGNSNGNINSNKTNGNINVNGNSNIDNISNNESLAKPGTAPAKVGRAVNINDAGKISEAATQQGKVNTSGVPEGSSYLIETRPQYTSLQKFYGSQYLLDHLNIAGSYMFLGDAGFDSNYIQQQYLQATGHSFVGGTYNNAADMMKELLDNATDEADQHGFKFGTALTKEQQASLAKDIVWYVPALVDGRQVLVPQLYLSPKTAVISGAAIVGKDVGIQAGSILNSGLMEGTHSIALTSTHGNIINDGGTIRGGDMSLNAQNGSIINRDTINNYLVEGGTSSYLGSQGKILASGTMGIKASDSIITRGGSIQSGSDMAMQAGSIDIGAAQLNAAASSASYGKHEMLAFNGNQTKNYGTMVSAGRNAILQSTRGDLNLAGSTLNVGGDAALSSAGNIGLNAVTDKGLTDIRGHKSGAFNSSSFEEKRAYTNDIGSAVIAGGQIGITAKNDVSLAGAVASKNDVNINAGGNITENALNYSNDTYDYHQTKKFGFFTNEAQLSVQIGQKNVTDKKSTSNSLHTASDIISTEGNVNLNAGKDININGSNVIAGRDINMSGDSVNFNAVQDVFKGDQKHKDSFTGIGLSASGLLANLAKTGFAAANTTDERMEALNAADMAS
ncbi:two-partner secretion domain-containing protein, partial [Commensalibacter melissae]|uniref:two-partner secretion domain-containing protein n=1 Tax=Commensalibacter melissae TaxID=2070537 RepID=UPI0012D97223